MNGKRYQKQTDEETTHYLGKSYMHIENTEFGFTEERYFITMGERVMALYSVYHGTRYENAIRYLHYDALGSVDAITDAQGRVVERSAYKPFGERVVLQRDTQSRAITHRGFTGHEEIEGTELIHMNARVYDPTLGRFMSADTLIQDPNDLQTYNRYAYVRNNPLKYTDPSGHSFLSIIKALITVAVVAFVAAAVLASFGLTALEAGTLAAAGSSYAMTAIIASGAIAGFAGGVVGALLDGASPGQAFIAGLTGGVLGGLTAGISTMIGNMSSTIARAISHGVVSGIRAVVQGGNFIRGFMSSFASTYLQPLGRMFAKGSYYGRAVFSALVGGTVSAIGGGKFANGAVTSAFQFVFNEWGHVDTAFTKDLSRLESTNQGKELLELARTLKVKIDLISDKSASVSYTRPIVTDGKVSSIEIHLYLGDKLNAYFFSLDGRTQFSRLRALVHELGHAVSGRQDDGRRMFSSGGDYGGMYIVRNWENYVMYPIDGELRLSYEYSPLPTIYDSRE